MELYICSSGSQCGKSHWCCGQEIWNELHITCFDHFLFAFRGKTERKNTDKQTSVPSYISANKPKIYQMFLCQLECFWEAFPVKPPGSGGQHIKRTPRHVINRWRRFGSNFKPEMTPERTFSIAVRIGSSSIPLSLAGEKPLSQVTSARWAQVWTVKLCRSAPRCYTCVFLCVLRWSLRGMNATWLSCYVLILFWVLQHIFLPLCLSAEQKFHSEISSHLC